MRTIYLDHAATTAVDPRVLEAMLPVFTEVYGNASSMHHVGQAARKLVEEAREKVAKAIGAAPGEIYFTSGGTEADNLAVLGVAEAMASRKGKHLITTGIEHHAIFNSFAWLKENGFEISELPVDQFGMVNPADLEKAIRPDTILVSIMHANNEIGTIQPIAELGLICKAHKITFHVDAVQTVGHLPIDVNAMNIDLLSMSAHKFYGPKGVGALYLRRGVRIKPHLHGGEQEKGLRPGTENVPGIVGLGRAIEIAVAEMAEENAREAALRDQLIAGLLKIPDVRLNGHPTRRLSSNVNVSIAYIEGESILLSLDLQGICASSGSACASGSLEPSHVLLAIGLDHPTAHGSLRLTLGRENTAEDVDFVLQVMPEIVQRLRKMSPIYPENLRK
ncbi:MAG: cysteine desulfurase NifS [Negativicutes bacterium]|nr:cysteine desulfurase NifS [Negativicutes bacterium]